MKTRFHFHIPAATIKWPYVAGAVLLYLVLLASAHFFILRPQSRHYATLRQKQSSLNELYLQVRGADIEQILISLQKEAAYLQQAQHVFLDRCITSQEISRLLTDLNRLAQKNNLKVQSIDPLPSSKMILNNYQQKSVSMRVTGSFVQVLSFLNDISFLPYWILLENLSIVHQSANGEAISLTVYTITR